MRAPRLRYAARATTLFLGAKFCPYHQALRFIESRIGQATAAQEEDPFLFAALGGEPLAKAAFVAEWQAFAPAGHEQLGGHSARRSGAKWYTPWVALATI